MTTALPLQTLARQFTTHGRYLRNWAPRTVKTYEQGLSSLQQSLRDGIEPPAGGFTAVATGLPLTKTQLEAWVISMRQRGLTPGGCNMYIRTINSFLTWLHTEGHTPERLRLKLLRDPKNPPAPFSEAQVRRLLAHRPAHFSELRLWTIVNVLLDTGCRIDEALKLTTDRVDMENLILNIRAKGGDFRRIPFSVELRKVLFRYVIARQKRGTSGSHLFATASGLPVSYRNVHRDLATLCASLGIVGPRISPHTLRHFFAVNYIRRGGDVYRLSRMLGHSSISTTQTYLRSMGVDILGERHSELSPLSRLR